MTHADKKMNPVGLHFGSNPADIRIRIRINPEIRIRIPDQILALAECALSECSGLHFCVWLCVYSVQEMATIYPDRVVAIRGPTVDSMSNAEATLSAKLRECHQRDYVSIARVRQPFRSGETQRNRVLSPYNVSTLYRGP